MIRLFNSLTQQKEPFEPRDPGKAGIYACGPTVYNLVHVGNARPYVVFAVLRSWLRRRGLDVTLVTNITDVDDKIITKANAEGRPATAVAEEFTAAYVADTGRLGIPREIRTESVEPAKARSRLHSSASALAGSVEIRVQVIGRDIAEQLTAALDEYLAMAPAAMHLHLPATDPAAAWAAAELQRIGFAWCAWTPAFLPAGDSIRLQRVSDHPIDRETIVCARAEGEQVRDFVVAQWIRVHQGSRGA